MADPKIRFDILANAQGADEVSQLANELEKLDGSLDPDLAARAKETAAQLREVGRQQEAIGTFVALKTSALAASSQLDSAQQSAQAYAREIAAAGEPTRTQAGRLERLRDAVREAARQEQAAVKALDDHRQAMAAAGVETSDLAAKTLELKRRQAEAVQSATELKTAQAAAAAEAQRAAAAQSAADKQRAAIAAAVAASNDRAVASARQAAAAREQAAQRAAAADEAQRRVSEAAALSERLRQDALIARSREIARQYGLVGSAAADSSAKQNAAAGSVKSGLESIGSQLRTLQALAATVLGGQMLGGLVGEVSQTADAYANLSARIRLVTGDNADFERSLNGVFDVATRTNTNVAQTADLFTRIARAGQEIGLGNEAALALTETINQAVQVSGGSAESSSAAITQLIQGLQSGVLRGEEFNSVMEQAPRLAQALADGLGMTTDKLREQAQAGALTSKVVIEALQGQSRVVQAEFSQMPATVGRAIQNLSTEWTRYVGEVDQANGISQKAAESIQFLAEHLDDLAALLFSVGKAAAAYKAIQLAQEFLAVRAAARAAAVEVVALDAAQNAAAVSGGAAADGAGRLAAMVGTLKMMSLVGIVMNFEEIGTWIGESAAKLMGWGKVMEDNERKMKAFEEGARQAAKVDAELAQKMQLARDAAIGLNDVSRKMVAEFESVIKKGEGTTAAIEKLAKSFNLVDLQGITNAGAALEALRLKGELTAAGVRDAWSKALNGQDLVVFATKARAAFDDSAQGAERLKAALDAVADESLRRVGTSVDELKTGFNSAMNSALNDADALADTLERLGISGEQSGRLLGASLDKALDAAKTEQAVQAVIERMEQLGQRGLITGDQMAQGLEKARNKLDDLKPGINSLEEAMRKLGLTSDAVLRRTAGEAKQAYDAVRNSGVASAREISDAFKRSADAAIAANGGVIPMWVRAEASARGYSIAVDGAGRETLKLADAAGQASGEAGRLSGNLDRVGGSADGARGKVERLAESLEKVRRTSDGFATNADGSAAGSFNNNIPIDKAFAVKEAVATGNFSGITLEDAQAAYKQAMDAKNWMSAAVKMNPGAFSLQARNDTDAMVAASKNALERLGGSTAGSGARGISQAGRTSTVVIKMGGKSTSVNTASDADADALTDMLKQLQNAAGRTS